jgi:hypothetical protein
MDGMENRQLDRFELEIPVLLDSFDQSRKEENICLLSRDLSGNGVFVFTSSPLSLNALVKLGMILDIKSVYESGHKQYSLIEVEGIVIRVESAGMAIRFENTSKISPIEGGWLLN